MRLHPNPRLPNQACPALIHRHTIQRPRHCRPKRPLPPCIAPASPGQAKCRLSIPLGPTASFRPRVSARERPDGLQHVLTMTNRRCYQPQVRKSPPSPQFPRCWHRHQDLRRSCRTSRRPEQKEPRVVEARAVGCRGQGGITSEQLQDGTLVAAGSKRCRLQGRPPCPPRWRKVESLDPRA